MNIVLIERECLHCGQFIDKCWYQRKLREFGLIEAANAMSREVETPPLEEAEPEWTSSDLYRKSS